MINHPWQIIIHRLSVCAVAGQHTTRKPLGIVEDNMCGRCHHNQDFVDRCKTARQ